MGVVIIDNKITRENVAIAREEYSSYIKITADIVQK